jgi:hypothetical protein
MLIIAQNGYSLLQICKLEKIYLFYTKTRGDFLQFLMLEAPSCQKGGMMLLWMRIIKISVII